MTQEKQIETILKKTNPDEVELLGFNMIFNITSSVVQESEMEIIDSKEGSNLELTTLISLVSAIVGIIDIGLKIIDLKKEDNTQINREELAKEIEEKVKSRLDLNKIPQSNYEKVINELLNQDDR